MKTLGSQMASQDSTGVLNDHPDIAMESEVTNGDIEVIRQPDIAVVTTSTPKSNKTKRVRSISSSSSTITTNSSDLGSFPPTPDYDGDARSAPFSALGMVAEGDQEYRIPVVGYEIMEERARFTVFKIQVHHKTSGGQWHVFRRYTDFVRLNRKLRALFPGIRFKLPSKRWFGDNFDSSFLEDRTLGLQAYIDNILLHKNIYQSSPVREFFCFDEPPGVDDSLEESQARCDSLEETVFKLRDKLQEKTTEVDRLKSELRLVKAQLATLTKSLRLECSLDSLNDSPRRSASLQKLQTLNVTLLNVIDTKRHQPGRSTSMVNLPSRNSTTSLAFDISSVSSNIIEDDETVENEEFDGAEVNGNHSVNSPDSETGEVPSPPDNTLGGEPAIIVDKVQVTPDAAGDSANADLAEK